ncbi:TPA: hypothetical protein EYP13_00025 [Candidatus Micrarchaeota archaeon]|nr:hypothetical protein [Candidatus Micrarchaeota archaeon]
MDWWFVVAYLAFLLAALNVLLSVPDVLPVSAYGCALSADAASVHGFSGVDVSGCVFSADSAVGAVSVPLVGRAVETPAGVAFEYVGG